MTEDDRSWEQTKERMPVGTMVSGVVQAHRSFGVFVELDDCPFVGLVQITDFGVAGLSEDQFPAVGTRIRLTVVGFKESGRQIWLAHELGV